MQSKNRRCSYCKKKVPAETAKITRLKAFCSTDHAIAWLESESGSIALKKAQKAKLQAKKRELKTRSDWLKEAQTEFNRYIRLRDAKDPCICCGRHHKGQYHAGHYLSVGAHPNLRFDEANVHKQASYCNNYKSGNQAEYRIRLIEKIGLPEVERLEADQKPKKYTVEQIKEIKAKYRRLANQLEKELK